jgi:hypothetical protein
VTVTANTPPDGKVFDRWTTNNGGAFADANAENTTFTMPPNAVTVTATYTDAPVTVYALTVSGGTGSGSYAADATVPVTANTPPDGKVFDQWTTNNGGIFADAYAANTTFTMPPNAVTVTATYTDDLTANGEVGNQDVTIYSSMGKLIIKADILIEKLEIYNLFGQKLKVDYRNNKFIISGLPKGVLIVKAAMSNQKTVIKKILML